MKTHVEFRSSKFPSYDAEGEVNPGRYGKRLAEFLSTELPKQGITTGEIYDEDWGWGVTVVNQKFDLWVGCGNYDEYDDGFLVFIEPSKPFVRRLFRKIDTTADVERVANALEKIFELDPEIHSVKWWTDPDRGV